MGADRDNGQNDADHADGDADTLRKTIRGVIMPGMYFDLCHHNLRAAGLRAADST
jgi:hypothetical protein